MDRLVLELPLGSYLERTAQTLVLRRPDGSVVGTLSEGENGRDQRTGQPRLRVRFFGSFELSRDGEPVRLGHNGRALAILKYLLANRSRPVSQDYLMDWLWPESNLKHARWSLNSAIYALRRTLGGCLGSPRDTVPFENGRYRLSSRLRISTDADEFDARFKRGRSLQKVGRAPDAEYERAVALYRDDYLVEDLYEEWTEIERGRLMDAYTEMLGSLAIHHMERGEYRESVDLCYRILEKDLCCERTHRLLMESFARLGQRGRALRQYGMCERSLARQWGAEPSPETRATYSKVLEERAVKEWR
ncbi:MAG: AfsR/SARP family transcriptional regulator [Rubrobacteraceae bacterium]